MDINDLRDAGQFFPVVADRIWRAWWEPLGAALQDVEAALRAYLVESNFPFTLVAHEGEKFIGTASAIANDLSDRPQYSPWLAALWVEPMHRNKGVARALVDRTERLLLKSGRLAVYLCAKPDLRPFYQRLGWTLIEEGVGDHQLCVFVRGAAEPGP